MKKLRSRKRRTRKSRRLQEDQALESAEARNATRPTNEQLGTFYATGPVFGLGATREEEPNHDQASKALTRKEEVDAGAKVEPVPPVRGEGKPEHATAFNLRLQGRTDATFDGGSFQTTRVVARHATGCRTCPARACVRVTGNLVATYSVATRVTLPRVPRNLRPCQRRRVRDAINNILAPHEQQHVAAFRTYNGRTVRRFDLTICRSQFNTTIRSMFEAEERTRRNAVQAASDALDPFHVDIDLNCKDTPQASRKSQGSDGGELDADTEE